MFIITLFKCRPEASRKALVACALLLLAQAGASALASAPVATSESFGASESVAGKVRLVLGKSWLYHADGSFEQVQVGTTVGAGDRIETGQIGHVHVFFVDRAMVAVRPSSRLEIIRYDFVAEKPSASVVKLNLVEGVTRAISGDAAKEAKEKFRLNTPIAAIGVRGTDFVVRASRASVRAVVNEGAIVMAPFSNQCSAEAYGPCSQNAMELAGELAEGRGDIVELAADSAQPQILQLQQGMSRNAPPDAPDGALIAEASPAAETQGEEETDSDIYTDSVTTLAVNQKISDSADAIPEPGEPEPEVPEPPGITEYTPDEALGIAALTNESQLVWGRWQERRLAEQRITVDYVSALENREAMTEGGGYVLFRSLTDGPQVMKPGLGVLAFDLSMAQAVYRPDVGGREAMDVLGGSLNVNFDERSFNTSLDLFHPVTGDYRYTDSGTTLDNGLFRNRSDGNATAGVVSLDGEEAGYFFESTLDSGRIEGITLWNRQP